MCRAKPETPESRPPQGLNAREMTTAVVFLTTPVGIPRLKNDPDALSNGLLWLV